MILSNIILENMRYAAYQIEQEIQRLMPLSDGTKLAAAQAATEAARAATEAVQSANEMIEKLNSKFDRMQTELDGYKRRRMLASSAAKKVTAGKDYVGPKDIHPKVILKPVGRKLDFR